MFCTHGGRIIINRKLDICRYEEQQEAAIFLVRESKCLGILPITPLVPGYPCSVPGYPWSVPGYPGPVPACSESVPGCP